jgi:hypothetical protein
VTGGAEEIGAWLSEILVVSASRASPDRQLEFTMPRELRPMCEAGADVLVVDAGVVGLQVGEAPTARQKIEHQRDPHAVPGNARLAEADIRPDRNPL